MCGFGSVGVGDCHALIFLSRARSRIQDMPALMLAAYKGRVEVIPLLVAGGADKDLQNEVRRLGAYARLLPRPVLTVVSPSPLSDRTVKRR